MQEENNPTIQQAAVDQMPKLVDDKPLLEEHNTAITQQPAGYRQIEIQKEPAAAPAGVETITDVSGLKDTLTGAMPVNATKEESTELPADQESAKVQNSIYSKLFPVSLLLFLSALAAAGYLIYKYLTL